MTIYAGTCSPQGAAGDTATACSASYMGVSNYDDECKDSRNKLVMYAAITIGVLIACCCLLQWGVKFIICCPYNTIRWLVKRIGYVICHCCCQKKAVTNGSTYQIEV